VNRVRAGKKAEVEGRAKDESTRVAEVAGSPRMKGTKDGGGKDSKV
jgi:hypothetical protein